MKRCLLDSDAFSDIVLRRYQQVNQRADAYFLAHQRHHLSVVTWFEVMRGFFRIGALDKGARVQRDSHDGLEVFPMTEGVAMTAAEASSAGCVNRAVS